MLKLIISLMTGIKEFVYLISVSMEISVNKLLPMKTHIPCEFVFIQYFPTLRKEINLCIHVSDIGTYNYLKKIVLFFSVLWLYPSLLPHSFNSFVFSFLHLEHSYSKKTSEKQVSTWSLSYYFVFKFFSPNYL